MLLESKHITLKTIWQTEVGIGVKTAPKKGFISEGCRSAALGGPKDLEDIVPQVRWKKKLIEGLLFPAGNV